MDQCRSLCHPQAGWRTAAALLAAALALAAWTTVRADTVDSAPAALHTDASTGASAGSQTSSAGDAPAKPPHRFAIYGQSTFVEQGTGGFQSPYAGPNSLTPNTAQEVADATLFLGARLWHGAELWMNPETDQGFGIGNTLGVAGYPNGEAYKIGRNVPYFRLQRAFVRQTFNFGDATTVAQAGPNQFAIPESSNRLVLTAGKLSVVDIFDVNPYAHDPTADFLNWSIIDAGTFDYAADPWGYTLGGAAEWYTGPWAVRAGVFDLSQVPNSTTLSSGFKEYQVDMELEYRQEMFGRPGKVDLTFFESHASMALLASAVAYAQARGLPVNPAPVRSYRKRDGVSLNFAQQLTDDLGVFARVGDAAGNVETYEFTDIDYTASGGISLTGQRWHRPNDTFGLATVVNAISKNRQHYLAAGGLGILIGDGQLPHPGHEHILETYYNWAALAFVHLTFDYQWVENPAYNEQRGPISIFAVRFHVDF